MTRGKPCEQWTDRCGAELVEAGRGLDPECVPGLLPREGDRVLRSFVGEVDGRRLGVGDVRGLQSSCSRGRAVGADRGTDV